MILMPAMFCLLQPTCVCSADGRGVHQGDHVIFINISLKYNIILSILLHCCNGQSAAVSPHLRACNHANCGGVTELALVKLLMPQRPVMGHDMSGVVINVDIDTFGNLLLQLQLLLSTII